MKEFFDLTEEQLFLLKKVSSDFRSELLTNFVINKIIEKYYNKNLDINDLEIYLNIILKYKIGKYKASVIQTAYNHKYLNSSAKPIIRDILYSLEAQASMFKEMSFNNEPKISQFEIWLVFITHEKRLLIDQIDHSINLIVHANIDEVNNISTSNNISDN